MRDSQSETDSLSESLGRHDERETAGATGILLEEIAKELSWRVPISVPRKEGETCWAIRGRRRRRSLKNIIYRGGSRVISPCSNDLGTP